MRKILLATTALVAFAGAAQAAESPIQVTLGGSVDFRAALVEESDAATGGEQSNGDFQTEYALSIAAQGKAANGIEYGSLITFDNDNNTGAAGNNPIAKKAYVWMSGAFGKVLMGDEHGASDLFIIAPTVGEAQIDGDYSDFVTSAAGLDPMLLNSTEKDTKITYYTPKVGNAKHKVQLGVSFAPNTNDRGYEVTKTVTSGEYENTIEAAAVYTGSFAPVNVAISPMIAAANGSSDGAGDELRDYVAAGVGAQAEYAGFTLGGSYMDIGNADTMKGDGNVDQNVWTLGLSYSFDKVAVAANYMDAETAEVEGYKAIGLGATYTWFPGLTTNADAVFFDEDNTVDNKGHVLMLSQKMSF